MKLLAICDSPTARTGFARVAKNLLPLWRHRFSQIDVWGINYFGWPHDLPYRIYPAGGSDWCSKNRLQALIDRIQVGGYSHLWIMQDPFGLVEWDFAPVLHKLCREKKIRSLYYAPVDAPWDPYWTEIVDAVHCPVAYTQWGREQITTARLRRRCLPAPEHRPHPSLPSPDLEVIPHGVESVFRPLPDRGAVRAKWLRSWQDKYVILNVNTNSPRKGLTQTFQLFAELQRCRPEARLIMHMPNECFHERSHDLDMVAGQFGLEPGRDWVHTNDDQFFGRRLWVNNHAQLDDEGLNELYNTADLYLTTSLGEGWGLGVVEALAAGTPAAAPDHTACGEVLAVLHKFDVPHGIPLPVSRIAISPYHDTRVRYPVDVPAAVDRLLEYTAPGAPLERTGLTPAAREWLNWGRIARLWEKLM